MPKRKSSPDCAGERPADRQCVNAVGDVLRDMPGTLILQNTCTNLMGRY